RRLATVVESTSFGEPKSTLGGTWSPPARIRFFIARQSRAGFADFKRAAAPATCGAAIDVPDRLAYRFPGNVLRMLSPGAAMWTVCRPKLENSARVSSG